MLRDSEIAEKSLKINVKQILVKNRRNFWKPVFLSSFFVPIAKIVQICPIGITIRDKQSAGLCKQTKSINVPCPHYYSMKLFYAYNKFSTGNRN
jgi:hypothetical protein